MGAYKNYLINVEELVWSAMERGITDENGIYAYVFMHEERVTPSTVSHILEKMHQAEQEWIEADKSWDEYCAVQG